MQYQSRFRPLVLNELVQLTGLSKSQIQNWTSGRPFSVIPTVAAGRGKGTRQLFALEDAYLFCFLEYLRQQGLSSSGLTRVVDFFQIWFKGDIKPVFRYFCPEVCWLVVSLTKHVLLIQKVEATAEEPNPRSLPPMQVDDFHDRGALQISVNFAKLREEVDERAKKLFGQAWLQDTQ